MRPYPMFIILLLSFLLPLHVAASTLLSAQTCPAKSALALDTGVIGSSQIAPDCCDGLDKTMDCQQMQSCHGCNISCQLFTAVAPDFNVLVDSTPYSSLNTPSLGLFDPTSVWRPPTNS